MSQENSSINLPSDRFALALANLTLKYRWLVILFSLIIVFACGFGASKLEFKNNYRIFMKQLA